MFEVFAGVVRTPPIPDGHASISPRGSIASVCYVCAAAVLAAMWRL